VRRCGFVQFNPRHFVQFRPRVSLWSVYCGPTSALRGAIHVIHKLLHVSAPGCHRQGVIGRLGGTPLLLQLPDDGTSVPKHVGINVCYMLYVLHDDVHWLENVLIINFGMFTADSGVLQHYLSSLVDFS